MQNLYRNIIDIVNSNRGLFSDAGLEPISTIDIYAGQPAQPEEFEFTYPAIFVDYKIKWERGGSMRKGGFITCAFHILTHPMPGTESWNPSMEKGLNRLAYYDLLSDMLEGVSSDAVGSLCLIGEEPMTTDYGTYHMLTFDAPITRFKTSQR